MSDDPRPAATRDGTQVSNRVTVLVLGVVMLGIAGYAAWSFSQLPTQEELDAAMSEDGDVHVVEWSFEPAKVPHMEITFSGVVRDAIPALVDPSFEPIGDTLQDPRLRVIGVQIGGESKAYPINILNYHQVVNDRLGGRDIAVTFDPLADAAIVVDRAIDGQTLEFGVSGRLYRANSLLFDRQATPKEESLWSPLRGEAITGPAVSQDLRLERVDSEVTGLGAWRDAHPESQVLSLPAGTTFNYGTTPFASYFESDEVGLPLPEGSQRRRDGAHPVKNKSPTLVVAVGPASKAYLLADLKRHASEVATNDEVGGQRIELRYDAGHVEVTGPDELVRHQAFWFAVDIFEPETPLWEPPRSEGPDGPTGEADPGDAAAAATGDADASAPAASGESQP